LLFYVFYPLFEISTGLGKIEWIAIGVFEQYPRIPRLFFRRTYALYTLILEFLKSVSAIRCFKDPGHSLTNTVKKLLRRILSVQLAVRFLKDDLYLSLILGCNRHPTKTVAGNLIRLLLKSKPRYIYQQRASS